MQCAIDNAKRTFNIDITSEIDRIKKDMNIKDNGYPKFWKLIKGDEFNKDKINKDLVCPMNYLFDLKFNRYKSGEKTLPMSYFFQKYELDINRRTCKKVEELIQKYSFDLYKWSDLDNNNMRDNHILLLNDFEELVEDLRITHISKNYLGLMSWLLDRAFMITPSIRNNEMNIISKLNMNKSILFATLYKTNKDNFLKCWSKNP